MRKKGMRIIPMVSFLFFFAAGTAAADVYHLAKKSDRAALMHKLETRGVVLPKEALPEIPVVLTFDSDANKVVLETKGPVSKQDGNKLLKLIHKSGSFIGGAKKLYVIPLPPNVIKESDTAKETPKTTETAKVSKPAASSKKTETAKSKEAAAAFHPNENAVKAFPKELPNGMVLEKVVRQSGHGFEMTVTQAPSLEEEREQKRKVQALGLRVGNHGMVEGVRNPLRLTFGGKAPRGRE